MHMQSEHNLIMVGLGFFFKFQHISLLSVQKKSMKNSKLQYTNTLISQVFSPSYFSISLKIHTVMQLDC